MKAVIVIDDSLTPSDITSYLEDVDEYKGKVLFFNDFSVGGFAVT